MIMQESKSDFQKKKIDLYHNVCPATYLDISVCWQETEAKSWTNSLEAVWTMLFSSPVIKSGVPHTRVLLWYTG